MIFYFFVKILRRKAIPCFNPLDKSGINARPVIIFGRTSPFQYTTECPIFQRKAKDHGPFCGLKKTGGTPPPVFLAAFCLRFGFFWQLFKLWVVQSCIVAAFGQKFFMGTLFLDIPVLHVQDLVRVFNRRQAVGDDKGSPAGH